MGEMYGAAWPNGLNNELLIKRCQVRCSAAGVVVLNKKLRESPTAAKSHILLKSEIKKMGSKSNHYLYTCTYTNKIL